MRKYLNGGYYTIDLEDGSANRNELLDAINYGKAIMIKFNTQTYFADSVVIDEDTQNIIITKGGKTITIDEYGDVDDVGDIQPEEKHLYTTLFDSSDLILENEDISLGHSQYYVILQAFTPNSVKLSELPNGEYTVITGTVIDDGYDIELNILIKTNEGYNFYTANDVEIPFTISTDNIGHTVKIF